MKRALAAAALLALLGCGTPQGRVIVLGLDGLDPQTVDLLMSEGKLPSFARLRQEGAYGTLRASPPLLSPVLWTTIATGKGALEHGIGHFVSVDRASGAEQPVESSQRRVKALWNIVSDAGLKAVTVGWWATWPPEPINGAVVSDHTCYHFLLSEQGGGGDTTFPPELQATIAPLIRRPQDVGPAEASRFITVAPEELARPFDFADEVAHFRWALATGTSYRDVGLELWRTQRPELEMVYIEGVDSVSHLFGHLFRAENLAGELARQQQRYGRAVEQMYLWADDLVGRYLEAMDRRTTLVVVSDHGFALGRPHDDPSRTRDLRRVSERFHREEGVLYLYGNNIRRHARVDGATQLDVVPTLLTLLGLEVAKDLPGRVLAEALRLPVPPRTLATYENGQRPAPPAAAASGEDAAITARLRALGYLEGGTEASSPAGDRNLAGLHFAAGRYQEALAIYERLIAAGPADSALYASKAGCLGALGRYDEAVAALGKALELDPLSVEAYHNRAVIEERRGRVAAAVEDYRRALRYAPDYEPSRQALVRLTGSAAVRTPTSAAEGEAEALAERAADAARRGDYGEATQLLEEAKRLAPGSVVVHQYESNVAYLAGDLERAARAAEQALRLEPDNALLRHNLETLRRELAGRPTPPASGQ